MRLAKCLFVDVAELNYFVMFIFLVVHIVFAHFKLVFYGAFYIQNKI